MTLSVGAAYAKALLKQLKLERIANICAVAEELRLAVSEIDVEGFDGALVRPVGIPAGEIVVRNSIREKGRKHFTVAHEIGHFLLPGHDKGESVCTSADLDRWSTREEKTLEQEANEFAAELLIPTDFARPIVRKCEPSLDVIADLAKDCDTSLSATAWRYCDLTSFRCAVIWNHAGIRQWCKKSEEFGSVLRMKTALPVDSWSAAAYRDRASGTPMQPVKAETWIESFNLKPEAEIWEGCKFLKNYDSIITLLWIKDRIEAVQDDDEPDESLDPNDFTIQRKRW
jgi:Zn-dependent peptidase ImmA (M78 family)